jgi:hypothetical protein
VEHVSVTAFSSVYMDFIWKFYHSEITNGKSHRDLNQVMMKAMAVLQYKWKDNSLLEYWGEKLSTLLILDLLLSSRELKLLTVIEFYFYRLEYV